MATAELDFAEAKRCYGEEMKICQEFNDRYGQASTYHQLGLVAQAEADFPEALRCLALALEIFLQYKDKYNTEGTIGNLGRLFSHWNPPPGTIAGLECSEQVKEMLRAVLEESKKKGGKKAKRQ